MSLSVKDKTILSLLLLAGFILRVSGIGFGLPDPYARPDEQFLVSLAMNIGSGDMNPHFFGYPGFFIYILFVCYGAYFKIGSLFGHFGGIDDFIREYATDPSVFYLIARWISVLAGTASIFLVWLIGQKLLGKTVGFISAAIFAFSFLPARDAHFGTTDTTLVFFILLSFLMLIKYLELPGIRKWLLAAFFAGLATSTKYAGVFLLFPAFLILFPQERGALIPALKSMILFVFFLGFGFFIGTPYALLDIGSFIAAFTDVENILSGIDTGAHRGWIHHPIYNLRYGFGGALLVFALIAPLIAPKEKRRPLLILCIFPLAYYLLTGWGYTTFARYTLPLFPFLSVLAAFTITYFSDFTKSRFPSLSGSYIQVLLLLFLIAPSLYRIIQVDRYLLKQDNRLVAKEYCMDQLPGGSIYQYNGGLRFASVVLEETESVLEEKYSDAVKEGQNARVPEFRLQAARITRHPGFTPVYPDEGNAFFEDGHDLKDPLPCYILTHEHPIKDLQPVPIELAELLSSKYLLIREFKAIETDAKGNYFDDQDAFFLPMSGFRGVIRPGPNISLYELRDSNCMPFED